MCFRYYDPALQHQSVEPWNMGQTHVYRLCTPSLEVADSVDHVFYYTPNISDRSQPVGGIALKCANCQGSWVCACVCVWDLVFEFKRVCVCVCARAHVSVYVGVRVFLRVYVCVCMHVRACVWIQACVYVCTCVYVRPVCQLDLNLGWSTFPKWQCAA